MSLRILHVLDHSIRLHSGYTFRTLSILREQRRLGWETHHLTSPKHHASHDVEEETVDGWHFYRTSLASSVLDRIPAGRELRLMRGITRRLLEVVQQVKPHAIHAHSPA